MASDESAVLFDQPGPKTRKTIRIVNWIAGIVFAIVAGSCGSRRLTLKHGPISICPDCGPRFELPCWQ